MVYVIVPLYTIVLRWPLIRRESVTFGAVFVEMQPTLDRKRGKKRKNITYKYMYEYVVRT